MNLEKLLKAYEEAEANEGFVGGEVLPKGKYPVRIAKVQDTGTSKEKGTPYVRLDLEVTDGPFKGRHAFTTVWLLDVLGTPEEELEDKDGKAWRNLQRCKGIMRALGLEGPGQVVGEYESTGEASLAFWRVDEWEGKAFLAGIGVETAEKQEQQAREQGYTLDNPQDRNRLQSWKKLDADTMQQWREKELPRQMKLVEKKSEGGGSEEMSI